MAIRTYTVVVLLLFFFLFLSTLHSIQDEIIVVDVQQQTPFFHRLRNWFSINTLFTRLFPPDIDFRGRRRISSDDQIEEGEGGGTGGEKVKEAVSMTLDQGKATVEKSAKSAAQKLKEAFSHEL